MNDSSSTNETFVPRWSNSELPYFLIIRDHSNYVVEDADARAKSSTPDSDNDGSPEPSTSIPETTCRLIYPEIHYVFSDDEFVPTVDALDMQDSDEMSIVIDFDQQGERIVGCSSFTPNWQVTNVSMSRKSDVDWSKATETELSTVILTVDGTSTELTLAHQLSANELIRVVQARNRQLQEVWTHCKELEMGDQSVS